MKDLSVQLLYVPVEGWTICGHPNVIELQRPAHPPPGILFYVDASCSPQTLEVQQAC